MAIQYICDCCGKTVERGEFYSALRISAFDSTVYFTTCDECSSKFGITQSFTTPEGMAQRRRVFERIFRLGVIELMRDA